MRIAWFSCGSASAIMIKLSIKSIDKIFYNETNSEHSDNKRFLEECEKWFGKKIERLSSEKFNNVDEVIEKKKYLRNRWGAPCSKELKINPRIENIPLYSTNLLGYTFEEQKRAVKWVKNNPKYIGEFPLITFQITKNDTLAVLKEVGIELPTMYKLGFEHNNCIGCVKSGSKKYWNMIRKHFPEVFWKRAQQERELNFSLIKGVFLDELKEDEADNEEQDFSCDIWCHSIINENNIS